MPEYDNMTNALECLLFAAKEPVAIGRLAEVLEVEATDLPRLLEELATARRNTGLQVVQLAGGWALGTRSEYAECVERLLEPDPERLSIQALETLAIIAYRQPLTRPEIDEVRGVNSSGAVSSLIDKDLIRITGRKEAPGRPFLLETTPRFLSLFGLNDLADLPDISELRRKMEQQGILITNEAEEPATALADEVAAIADEEAHEREPTETPVGDGSTETGRGDEPAAAAAPPPEDAAEAAPRDNPGEEPGTGAAPEAPAPECCEQA